MDGVNREDGMKAQRRGRTGPGDIGLCQIHCFCPRMITFIMTTLCHVQGLGRNPNADKAVS